MKTMPAPPPIANQDRFSESEWNSRNLPFKQAHWILLINSCAPKRRNENERQRQQQQEEEQKAAVGKLRSRTLLVVEGEEGVKYQTLLVEIGGGKKRWTNAAKFVKEATELFVIHHPSLFKYAPR